jgi:hypothetical protein
MESANDRPRRPAYQACPETERERLQPDDHLDRVGECDTRDAEEEQDGQRWDGEQQEPRLKPGCGKPLLHVGAPSELYLLNETGREEVGT